MVVDQVGPGSRRENGCFNLVLKRCDDAGYGNLRGIPGRHRPGPVANQLGLTTFDDYDKFAEATGREKPNDGKQGRGALPVINVSYDDATMTACANTLIQGAGADILKLSLANLSSHLCDEAHLVACVHDEIVLEVIED
ncbi:MAG: hypothetical protein EBZ13_07870, partial [Planctomycetia bacterium]|nr:hypothetical protein [Planctomycetia bacterium]